VRIRVLLADAAQVDAAGKVGALGLGWTNISTPLPGFAIIAILDIDWAELAKSYDLTLEILTGNGDLAQLEDSSGESRPLRFELSADLEVKPAIPEGTRIRLPAVFNFLPGMPLAPGKYHVRISVRGFEDAASVPEIIDVLTQPLELPKTERTQAAAGPPPP
jgi:hypothetical protein